jgi:hypothetical protein
MPTPEDHRAQAAAVGATTPIKGPPVPLTAKRARYALLASFSRHLNRVCVEVASEDRWRQRVVCYDGAKPCAVR